MLVLPDIIMMELRFHVNNGTANNNTSKIILILSIMLVQLEKLAALVLLSV
jgi:hypothetical protein